MLDVFTKWNWSYCEAGAESGLTGTNTGNGFQCMKFKRDKSFGLPSPLGQFAALLLNWIARKQLQTGYYILLEKWKLASLYEGA